MSLTEWRRAHQQWASGASIAGVIFGLLVSHNVNSNFFVQLIACVLISMVVTALVPVMAWFFASDGRRARP